MRPADGYCYQLRNQFRAAKQATLVRYRQQQKRCRVVAPAPMLRQHPELLNRRLNEQLEIEILHIGLGR